MSLLAKVAKDLLRQIVPLRQQRLLIRYALSNSSAVTLDQLHAKALSQVVRSTWALITASGRALSRECFKASRS